MKKLVSLSVALVLSLAVALPAHAVLQIGQNAPDFTLPGVGGTSYTLSDYEGMTVLINFWQSG